MTYDTQMPLIWRQSILLRSEMGCKVVCWDAEHSSQRMYQANVPSALYREALLLNAAIRDQLVHWKRVCAGLERIAEAEEGDTPLDEVSTAGPELSGDTASLRRGMARVKLEHGEASTATADGDDGALWPGSAQHVGSLPALTMSAAKRSKRTAGRRSSDT